MISCYFYFTFWTFYDIPEFTILNNLQIQSTTIFGVKIWI